MPAGKQGSKKPGKGAGVISMVQNMPKICEAQGLIPSMQSQAQARAQGTPSLTDELFDTEKIQGKGVSPFSVMWLQHQAPMVPSMALLTINGSQVTPATKYVHKDQGQAGQHSCIDEDVVL